MKKIFFLLFFLMFLPFLAQAQSPDLSGWDVLSSDHARAKVLSVEDKSEKIIDAVGTESVQAYQSVSVEILSGDSDGEVISFKNSLGNNPLNIALEEGDKIYLQIDIYANGQTNYAVMDYYRVPSLIFMFILFIVFILIIGGKVGIKTILGLSFTIFLIFYWLIPGVLRGKNPVILALLISVVATVVTLYLIGGRTKKTLSSILGTLSGIGVAVILTFIFSKMAYLQGLSTEDSRAFFASHDFINPLNLFFAGILVGTLGAVMDAAMSVASAVSELKKSKPEASRKELFRAGMNVGRDIMGTMANTLILAYVSVSLPMLLLYYDFGKSITLFLNFDFVADEVVRSLGGSMGLISSIPLTALFSAYWESRKS